MAQPLGTLSEFVRTEIYRLFVLKQGCSATYPMANGMSRVTFTTPSVVFRAQLSVMCGRAPNVNGIAMPLCKGTLQRHFSDTMI